MAESMASSVPLDESIVAASLCLRDAQARLGATLNHLLDAYGVLLALPEGENVPEARRHVEGLLNVVGEIASAVDAARDALPLCPR